MKKTKKKNISKKWTNIKSNEMRFKCCTIGFIGFVRFIWQYYFDSANNLFQLMHQMSSICYHKQPIHTSILSVLKQGTASLRRVLHWSSIAAVCESFNWRRGMQFALETDVSIVLHSLYSHISINAIQSLHTIHGLQLLQHKWILFVFCLLCIIFCVYAVRLSESRKTRLYGVISVIQTRTKRNERQ